MFNSATPWNSPGKNTGVGSCSLLQGIFLTQGLNPDLLHCGQILCCLSHQGIPEATEDEGEIDSKEKQESGRKGL